MRVAIFSVAYIPFVGGAELAIKEITDRLPDRDFVCFTYRFDSNWPVEEKIGNISVMRLGKGGKNHYRQFFQKIFYIFRAWRAAEKTHKQQPLDVIWAIMAAYGGFAALLFKLRHPKIPLLLTLQEGDSESHILRRVNVFYPLWRLIFKKADFVQTISHYLADFAKRHGAKCPIEVVPNGVDVVAFSVKRLADSDQSNALNAQPHTLITTSRLVHKNGIDILIQAIAVIAIRPASGAEKQSPGDRRVPQYGTRDDVKLQILGGGPEEENLKKLARDLNVENNVEFLGHIEPNEIPKYLARADVFVRPSRSEGLGSSFLEAMAAGLPIIGTPVGGIPDFLRDYSTNFNLRTSDVLMVDANGLFTKVDDPKDLAEKISLLFKDEKLRKKLGENGRKLVAEKYNWDNISLSFGGIFERLIK